MNLLKRIWMGKTKVKEPKVKEPKVKEPEEVTRREMVDRLFGVNIHWDSKLNEEVERTILTHINMVKSEWSITSDLVPSICREQSLSDHLKGLEKIDIDFIFNKNVFLSVLDGERKYYLYGRQLGCYIAALIGLERGEFQNFFHEFSDCIHNYAQNINEPINPAEKQALAAMMYYYFQKKDLTF